MLIEQITSRPTADINGIIGGYTGEGAKTVIPGQASAKVSFRLVGEQDPEKIRDNFREFVEARMPADCKVEFGNFSLAAPLQLSFDNPTLNKARTALAEEWGKKAVTVGAGGSIPIVADFKNVLGMDSLLVGFGSTTTGCIRRTRSSILTATTRASAPGRASSTRSRPGED